MKKYLPNIPLIVWMTLFVACPLIYIIILSFLTRGPSGGIVWQFSLENYSRLFKPLYLNIFIRSMAISLLVSLITLFIAYPFAYFLSNTTVKKKSLLLLMMMVPFWTNSLLRTYGFMILLRKDGVLNTILLKLQLIDSPRIFLYNYIAIIAGMVYMLLPFMVLPLFNSIEKLDKSFIEASRDLGASKAKTFTSITLPLTLEGVMSGVVLVFILAIGLFFVSDLLGGAKTMLIGNLTQLQMTSARDWPFGAAISVILILGVLISLWLYTKVIYFTSHSSSKGSFLEKGGGLFER